MPNFNDKANTLRGGPVNAQELEALLAAKEGDAVEFKEAKERYSFDELTDYCVALANEGGGQVVLGVTDKRPRKVVGTRAFPQPEQTLRGLLDRIPLRIDFTELNHPDGRVLIFQIPSRSAFLLNAAAST